jgi:hypothetical protein
MTNQLLFHEKCNSDIEAIFSEWKKQCMSLEDVKEALLMEYQRIFEYPSTGSSVWSMQPGDITEQIQSVKLFWPPLAVHYFFDTRTRNIIVLGLTGYHTLQKRAAYSY